MRFQLSRRHLPVTAVLAAILPLAGLTATAQAQPSAQASSQRILTFANKCADVMGGSTASGALIRQWTCNGTVSQDFTIVPIGGNLVNIKTFSGLCADVQGGNTADGTLIRQWTCNGTVSQQFTIVPTGDGHSTIRTFPGKCWDVRGASSADGTLITQWTCNNTVAQVFLV